MQKKNVHVFFFLDTILKNKNPSTERLLHKKSPVFRAVHCDTFGSSYKHMPLHTGLGGSIQTWRLNCSSFSRSCCSWLNHRQSTTILPVTSFMETTTALRRLWTNICHMWTWWLWKPTPYQDPLHVGPRAAMSRINRQQHLGYIRLTEPCIHHWAWWQHTNMTPKLFFVLTQVGEFDSDCHKNNNMSFTAAKPTGIFWFYVCYKFTDQVDLVGRRRIKPRAYNRVIAHLDSGKLEQNGSRCSGHQNLEIIPRSSTSKTW